MSPTTGIKPMMHQNTQQSLERLEMLAALMDGAFVIPGTTIRFGLPNRRWHRTPELVNEKCAVTKDSLRQAARISDHLNFDTLSACSRMTRALSSIGVPVGSLLYITRGFDQYGMRTQPSQLCW